jgi:hypothetical protein
LGNPQYNLSLRASNNMDQVQKEPENAQPAATTSAAVPQPESLDETQKQPADGATTHEEKQVETAAEPSVDKPVVKPVAPTSPIEQPSNASGDTPKADTVEGKKDEVATEIKTETPEPELKPSEAPPVDTTLDFLANHASLRQFFERLPFILEKTGHNEMWGVVLKDANDPPTANVMIKFLRANNNNEESAEQQLTTALEWRKKMNPLSLATTTRFSRKKFDGLGYITTYNDPKDGPAVFTWNIYGAVKDIEGTFGDVGEYVIAILVASTSALSYILQVHQMAGRINGACDPRSQA